MASLNIPNIGQENEGRIRPHPASTIGAADNAVLSPTRTLHHSPIKMRRESFTEHTPVFSPTENTWGGGYQFSIENGGVDSSAPAQAFFAPQSKPNIGTSQNGMVASQWPQSRPSGSCTPTPGFEHMNDFAGQVRSSFNQQGLQSSHQHEYEPLSDNAAAPYSFATFPASSTSNRRSGDWIPTSPTDVADFATIPTSTHSSSPVLGGSTQVLRRDGIRKKNARFEIPAERNLRTIDQLINQTNDEQEIKELKQQKRLLRNRQAALDSRQRKKQHTERLEEEKKQYTSVISDLEEALLEMRAQENEWAREKENFVEVQQQYQQWAESLRSEKEELIRRNTIETGELRKKNAILMEQLQRYESTAMSTAPSSNGFPTDFSDFDSLAINSWDDFAMPHDYSIEVEPRSAVPGPTSQKHEAPRDAPLRASEGENAMPAGFLLMLLLCGAWVASRGPTTTADLLPTLPDELRSASTAMLDNIYKDSGIPMQPATQSTQGVLHQPTMYPSFTSSDGNRPPLEILHQRLVVPTEEQAREQAFSLTPSQYNDLSAGIHQHNAPPNELRGSRTLDDVLSNVHASNDRVAETYTRSLLKDKVSTQVLQDFAHMVSQRSSHDHGQWKAETLD